ncbi:MAG: hypothetical protein KDJ26_06735 [Alphaproteobacteria bacterium]|nr:hypothetical protein [Alphaproteobacteria bacterium]MCB9985488.1 hypothetical protein [Micavibrio sp.]
MFTAHIVDPRSPAIIILCAVGREFVLKREMRKNARAMIYQLKQSVTAEQLFILVNHEAPFYSFPQQQISATKPK